MVIACRLCLVEYSPSDLTSIFKCNIKDAEDSLVDILFWVFAVEIDVTDLYPKGICDDCIQLIEYVVEIRNTFQKTQQSLQQRFQGNKYEELEVQPSEDPVNDKQTKARSVTPSTSSGEHSYGSSSPRIRVPLSTLETMFSITVNVERFEHSQEFMRYKEIRKGSFKKRKYRHCNLDDSLLDNICNTLDEKKISIIEELGASTEKNSNLKDVEFSVNSTKESCPSLLDHGSVLLDYLDLTAVNISNNHETNSMRDIIKNRTNLASSLSSPQLNKDSDWTRITSKKDIGTNTAPILSRETRSIGTLTKNFKQRKSKNVVRVNLKALDNMSPNVWLEPIEYLLGRENYQEISDFSYIKVDNEKIKQKAEKNPQSPMEVKKQRFVEYYRNIPSFAIRELIEGKKFRVNATPNSSFCSSDSENNPFMKVSNVSNVFVCKFCSRSFSSQPILNTHYSRAHKSLDIQNGSDENGSATNLRGVKKKQNKKHAKHLKRSISLDLRQKSNISNYNVDSIIRNKKRFKHNSPKVIKGKRKMKFKGGEKKKIDNLVDKKYIEETQFIWERKSLGTYTALTHMKTSDTSTKQDTIFDNTITLVG